MRKHFKCFSLSTSGLVPAAATSLLQAPPSYHTVQAGIEDDSQASNVIATNTGKQE